MSSKSEGEETVLKVCTLRKKKAKPSACKIPVGYMSGNGGGEGKPLVC